MNFDEVADELYSLTPEEFTATRNEREKQAKADGDKELAGRIRKLAKPNASAWLANRLVREHPEEIQPLLELGEDLRAAMADRDGGRLRELAKTQRLLISALVDEAKQDAMNAGRKVADEAARGLVDTLRSALADDRSARELLAGRLTAPLFRSGLEGDDDSPDNGADERPTAPTRAKAAGSAGGGAGGKAATKAGKAATNSGRADRKSAASKGSGATAAADQDAQDDQNPSADRAAQDERAEAARLAGEVAEAAEALATDARSDDEAARQAVTDAGAETEQLRKRITELEAELETATAALSAAKTAARRAGIDRQRAERAAVAARRRADALQDD